MADVNLSVNAQASSHVPLQTEVKHGFGNFHANQLNTGKDDNPEQKVARIEAMRRRMAKPY